MQLFLNQESQSGFQTKVPGIKKSSVCCQLNIYDDKETSEMLIKRYF